MKPRLSSYADYSETSETTVSNVIDPALILLSVKRKNARPTRLRDGFRGNLDLIWSTAFTSSALTARCSVSVLFMTRLPFSRVIDKTLSKKRDASAKSCQEHTRVTPASPRGQEQHSTYCACLCYVDYLFCDSTRSTAFAFRSQFFLVGFNLGAKPESISTLFDSTFSQAPRSGLACVDSDRLKTEFVCHAFSFHKPVILSAERTSPRIVPCIFVHNYTSQAALSSTIMSLRFRPSALPTRFRIEILPSHLPFLIRDIVGYETPDILASFWFVILWSYIARPIKSALYISTSLDTILNSLDRYVKQFLHNNQHSRY